MTRTIHKPLSILGRITARFGYPFLSLLAATSLPLSALAEQHPWLFSGYVSGQAQYFWEEPLDPIQSDTNVSIAARPEMYREWNEGIDSFNFIPFARVDQRDDERTHFDIRELKWQHVGSDWELRVGADVVFWGVAESRHLVDIVNQTDVVESIDGEDKLGQPMVNLSLIRDWGTLDFFVLPYFRERTFPGPEGRPRVHPPVNPDAAVFESDDEEKHIDLALRWSHMIGNWDIGLSHFHGTTRDPRFGFGSDDSGSAFLFPIYEQIDQTGVDVQFTWESWLLKLEAIRRSGQQEPFNAAVGGVEYTLYGLFDGATDLGLVGEYLYDGVPVETRSPFESDVFTGLRFTLNDAQSTEALAGCIFDLDSSSRFCSLEASRRFGSHWVGSAEIRAFSSVPRLDPFFTLRQDDFVQVELAYYF